jgi:uncharacterized protein YjbI with pentapeptide repeats
MKTINKQEFDRLLRENKKDDALAMLKDDQGKYFSEIQLGDDLKCKIFETVPEELFTEENTPLLPKYSTIYPEYYIAIILGGITLPQNAIIKRSEFGHWYFMYELNFNGNKMDETSFKDATFCNDAIFVFTNFVGGVNFGGCKFLKNARFQCAKFFKNASFEYTEFDNETYFTNSNFDGVADFIRAKFKGDTWFHDAKFSKEATFAGAEFKKNIYFGEDNESAGTQTTFTNEANFYAANFTGETSFKNVKFEENIFLTDAIFRERCDLRVEKFGEYVDFKNAEFRAWVYIDWKKLCNDEEVPVKAILNYEDYRDKKPRISKDYHKVRENLHIVKEMLHKVSAYNGEDVFYYWYKIFERENYRKDFKEKYKEKACYNKFKGGLNYIALFIKYWFFDRLFLDYMTGYFTKPWRVFRAIPSTIIIFALIYCVSPDKNHNLFGIQHNISLDSKSYNEILWDNVKFSIKDLSINEKHKIDLYLKNLSESIYFSAITFSTIGYGDYQPVGFWTMFFAAVEGIIGVLLMSTFLVTLTRKYLR